MRNVLDKQISAVGLFSASFLYFKGLLDEISQLWNFILKELSQKNFEFLNGCESLYDSFGFPQAPEILAVSVYVPLEFKLVHT